QRGGGGALAAVVVAVEDERVLVQVRRRRGAPAQGAGEEAEVLLPHELAGHVVAEDARRAEEGVDVLAVGGARRGGVAVPDVRRLLRHVLRRRLLPQDLAVAAAHAEDVALAALLGGPGEEDLVAPDDRR